MGFKFDKSFLGDSINPYLFPNTFLNNTIHINVLIEISKVSYTCIYIKKRSSFGSK
jgi:hypothetical protein